MLVFDVQQICFTFRQRIQVIYSRDKDGETEISGTDGKDGPGPGKMGARSHGRERERRVVGIRAEHARYEEAFVEGKKDCVSVRVISAQQMLRFSHSDLWASVKVINQMLSKWQMQQPSCYMSEHELLPSDVPRTFLNIALYSFCSVTPLLRLASYNVICAMKEAFHLQITGHILEAHNLCFCELDINYVKTVSADIACNEPHMSLEFLTVATGRF